MRKFWQTSLTAFLLASLLLHLGVWIALKFAPKQKILRPSDKIEIVVLDQRPAPTTEAQKRLQIVEQDEKPLNDEIPDEVKYLSAHNQRVVQESRARETGDFKNTAQKQTVQALQAQTAKSAKKNKAAVTKLADLLPHYDPTLPREHKPMPAPESTADENSAGQNAQQASQTNDHLKNVPTSLETLLNTREFVYYSYYQRIRTQIRQFWEPSIRAKVRRIFAQGRNIASERDHVTRVIIVLDKNGGLLTVKVVGESGVKDLDDAAIEAFRAAEPFPNPPKGIVDPDGTIKINWDFILEASLESTHPPQRYARSE